MRYGKKRGFKKRNFKRGRGRSLRTYKVERGGGRL